MKTSVPNSRKDIWAGVAEPWHGAFISLLSHRSQYCLQHVSGRPSRFVHFGHY